MTVRGPCGSGLARGLRNLGWLGVVCALPLAGQTVRVGADAPPGALRRLVEQPAGPDTIIVEGGRHDAGFHSRRPVVLIGRGWPELVGSGEGHVVQASAPLDIRGFVIRGSGRRVDTEDAGIMVDGSPARVVGNRLQDVFYGVYLKSAPGSLVEGNVISGYPLPPPRRGDGIRLWESDHSIVRSNDVRGTRDVVIYFSDSLSVVDNRVSAGRYGLHYMYSHHNRVEGNRFTGNEVGAFIMYSRGVVLTGNRFERSRGATGMGLGLKDADDIEIVDNEFFSNSVGLHLDNSPGDVSAANDIVRNAFTANDVAVLLLPSVRGNRFRHNDLVANRTLLRVPGRAADDAVAGNDWSGNHWSAYAGFDTDGDGVGDTPFSWVGAADRIVAAYRPLAVFTDSPALGLVDLLTRFFPLVRPAPLLVDDRPALRPQSGRLVAVPDPVARRLDPVIGVGWSGAAVLAILALYGARSIAA